MTMGAALYKGAIYAMSSYSQGNLYMNAIDMVSGVVKWKRHLPKAVFGDGSSLFVYNDTILFALRDHVEDLPTPTGQDGNNQFAAMNSSDGALLWEYTADDVIWNFMPSTPGDGTFLVANQCGGIYRMNWAGKLVWRAGRPNPKHWCSCGGGVLGPNGLFYVEFNDWERNEGVVASHRLGDGALVWERRWEGIQTYGGWQHPAVGRLAPGNRLAVVANLGGITGKPQFPGVSWLQQATLPEWAKVLFYERVFMKYSWVRRLAGVMLLPNAVPALDAETGKTIWWVEEEPWDHPAMAGDGEPFVKRWDRFWKNTTREDPWCQPDPQAIPLITGDGTVYAASGHTGRLSALRDNDGDGNITGPEEISTFETRIGFLSSPSLAPGMLVAAPCWGPVYVFKDLAQR
mmetsp:Transcript_108865/g.339265  ORF Transcript_108865/g.339265 Transcript_108865/m.339265 type:complete len:402 (+) Transcript_108865:8-1213(+)